MRRQRRTTIIVAGGALAIASVGYGLGTQAGDGTAIAESSQQRNGGPPALFFERGVPPGFSDLADKLGVDADELRRAMRDFRDQEHADRRKELSNALAEALGIPADRVSDALDRLHEKHEVRRADRMAPPPGRGLHVRHALPLRQLATQLGVSRADLRNAFRELRPDRPGRGFERQGEELAKFLADRFELDVDRVSDALAELGPPLRSGHRPGLPDHPPAP